MKIFITGAAGFIGGNFALKQLNNTKNKILNFDKLTYAGNLNTLSSIEGNERYTFVQGDITDASQVWESISTFKPDAIVNFAAESHVDRSIDGPMAFLNTNIMGTAVLLEACRKYLDENSNLRDSFRFLHVSTDEVYGSLGVDGFFTEDTSYDPSSPYSASKASSDHLVRAWQRTFNVPTLITNCSNNYGPWQYPEKLIPVVITKILRNKKIPIYGKGQNIRDWIHVEDHVNALIKISNKGEIGETYNIGGNNELTNIDLVNQICEIIDKKIPKKNSYKKLISFVEDRLGHDFRYSIDSTKMKKNINFKLHYNIKKGLLQTVSWYLKNKNWLLQK